MKFRLKRERREKEWSKRKEKELFVWKELNLGIGLIPFAEIWDENKQTRMKEKLTKLESKLISHCGEIH